MKNFILKVLNYIFLLMSKKIAQENVRAQSNLGNLLYLKSAESTLQYVEENLQDAIRFSGFSAAQEFWKFTQQEVILKNGLYIEVGVNVAMSTNFMASNIPDQTLHGFDTFTGLPEQMSGHNLLKGTFDRKGILPKVRKNVVLHKGLVQQTLPLLLKKNDKQVSFLHLDCSLYSAYSDSLNLLKDRLVKGSVIIFGSYFDYPFWETHTYRAWREFVDQNNINYKFIAFKGGRERGTENGSISVKIV